MLVRVAFYLVNKAILRVGSGRGCDRDVSPARPGKIEFPNDKSLAILYIRDLNSYDEDAWEEFIEAYGIVTVAPEKALKLKRNYDN